MRTVTLMIGTSNFVYYQMCKGTFNNLVWASNNLETVSHYWNGCVVELTVSLDTEHEGRYIGRASDYSSMPPELKETYGWGVTIPNYPKDALWYSFTGDYLKSHLIALHEIYPDLTGFED